MSEYIFRTEKPIKYCYECPLNNSENGGCKLGVETSGCEIPKKCSLKELPEPHGDLKDIDGILQVLGVLCMEENEGTFNDGLKRAAALLKYANVILEASK